MLNANNLIGMLLTPCSKLKTFLVVRVSTKCFLPAGQDILQRYYLSPKLCGNTTQTVPLRTLHFKLVEMVTGEYLVFCIIVEALVVYHILWLSSMTLEARDCQLVVFCIILLGALVVYYTYLACYQ